jgi:hypothetical protein
MVLFLSAPFLRRLRLIWKPGLTAFLVGDRNLFFFTPDSLVEVESINPQTIEEFYQRQAGDSWQLLGFISPSDISWQPGFAELNTGGSPDPAGWAAWVHLLAPDGPERRKLEIRIGSSGTEA